MLGVGTAVKVERDLVSLDGHGGNDDAIARRSGLALFEDHVPVFIGTGGQITVRLERDDADGNGAMREALLCL
jgi:hypothetical protein